MRKHLLWLLAAALAIGVVSVASAANVQTITGTFLPSNVSSTKPNGGKLTIVTKVNCQQPCSGPGAVKPATRAQVFFDKNIFFTTRGLAVCQPSKIQGKTSAQAKAACPKAQVGGGSAKVALGGDPSAILNATVTDFNGPPQGGKPTILLHTYQPDTATITVLTGVLKGAAGKYSHVLDVKIPLLPGGTAITEFKTTVQKSFKVSGNRKNYIAAKCSGDHKWDYKGVFTYQGNPSLTATHSQTCH